MTDYTATMENTSMFPAVKVTSDFPEESDSVRKLTKLSCVGTAVNNPASCYHKLRKYGKTTL